MISMSLDEHNVMIYLLSFISFILSKSTVFKLENWNVFFYSSCSF